MRVSVIIPNYNHARYLPERIDSILEQTYKDFEIIILDDCSTDNSREVIERYRENAHISQIIYNAQNSGKIFCQWQKGIELSKGELVWIAESDDKCSPLFLEKLTNQFNKNDNLVLAFCKSIAFSDDGSESKIDSIPLTTDHSFNGATFISQYMAKGCPMVNASSCLFKKQAANKVNKQYTEFRGTGDRMFWTEISEWGDVVVVNEWLNMYRCHATNSTKRNLQDGTNQREGKVILDYILRGGYISNKEYNYLRRYYVKTRIFEYLTDSNLKKQLYDDWDFGLCERFSLKFEAWFKRLKALCQY